MSPDGSDGYFGRGYAYYMTDRNDEAIADFTTTTELLGDNGENVADIWVTFLFALLLALLQLYLYFTHFSSSILGSQRNLLYGSRKLCCGAFGSR